MIKNERFGVMLFLSYPEYIFSELGLSEAQDHVSTELYTSNECINTDL